MQHKLNYDVRAEIIRFLVEQEIKDLARQGETMSEQERNELAVAWSTRADSRLIEANNYVRQRSGLPAKVYCIP